MGMSLESIRDTRKPILNQEQFDKKYGFRRVCLYNKYDKILASHASR